MDGGAWWAAIHGVAASQARLSDFTFTFHFPALGKEMATHFSVLAWRIPRTGEPGGLPSMGLHRVGHDWSDLAAAEKGREEEGYMSGKTSWNHAKYGAWSPLKDPKQEATWSVLHLKVSLVYWCANSWCTNSVGLFMLRTGGLLNWQKKYFLGKNCLMRSVAN